LILLSRAEEIILLSVYKCGENAYGVTIREQIHKDIGRYWSFGVIYKTLKKMKNKGFVNKNQGRPIAERGGRSRYYYEGSPDGLAAMKEISRLHSSIWEGIPNLNFGKKKLNR